MALDAVSTTINSTLVPLLSGEVKLLRNVHKEIATIKMELESMTSFLEDVDSNAKLEKEGDKRWVEQVRAMAYQIEDVMDEYILHLAENRQRRGFIGFLRKLARSVTKLKYRHDIASQIQGIKQTIREINERAKRYDFHSLEHRLGSVTKGTLQNDPRVASLFIEEDEVVGIESIKEELIQRLIVNESNRTVTSLVGMGGCGKTTLAKKIFDNERVVEHFHCQAWVTVSQSYETEDIFRTMMKQLCKRRSIPEKLEEDRILEELDKMTQNDFIHMLRGYLCQKRYLIICDDVWDPSFWNIIKTVLPKNDEGSQIIVTTRSEVVANFCVESPSDHVHKVEPLTEEAAWKLFCMKAFQRDFGGECPPELEEVSHAIVRKCEGLPLAIATIGALLRTKSRVVEWQRFYSSLTSELEENPHLTIITKIVLLSYHDLPSYLKPCFLYFSITPEDYQIHRGRLARLWIAEGFIKGRKGKTLEEVAEEYLTELIHRNLVKVSMTEVDGRILKCQVHDVVHQIILAKCEELSFCQVIRELDPRWDNETRRWSMQKQSITNKDLETISNADFRIRSVFLFSVGQLSYNGLLGTLAVNFKLMKVLDLEDAPLDELHKEVGDLLHLRYLSVKRTRVKVLPKAIGNLCNLQTLNLRHSHVFVLQTGILSRLRKLRHLIGSSRRLQGGVGLQVQGGIGHLEELQTMRYLEANDDFIRELEKLRQLRKLGITNLKREHGRTLCTAITKMHDLRSLRIKSIEDGEGILDLCSLSSPPKFLQYLSLTGVLETLPNWVSILNNLTLINLRLSKLTDAHALKSLQALPNLVGLRISDAYDGDLLYFNDGGFLKLKKLYLGLLKGLNSVMIEEGALPVLNVLVIDDCPLLKEVPSGIQNLSKLKSLYFVDMPTELLDKMQPRKGQDYRIIQHIPTVEFQWWCVKGSKWTVKMRTPQQFEYERESERLNDVVDCPSTTTGVTTRNRATPEAPVDCSPVFSGVTTRKGATLEAPLGCSPMESLEKMVFFKQFSALDPI